MPDALFYDAPLIEQDNAADMTDFYLHVADDGDDAGTPDVGGDTSDVRLVLDLAGGQDGAATDPFLSDDEDEFLFFASGFGNGNGTGTAATDSATPAPPEAEPEPPRGSYEYEVKYFSDAARHTATRGALNAIR